MMFEKHVLVFFVGISFLPPLWICVAQRGSLGSPGQSLISGPLKNVLSAVGYAWMLERNLSIHFKNITPAEILFCPQNLHCTSSHSSIPGDPPPCPFHCDGRELCVLAATAGPALSTLMF